MSVQMKSTISFQAEAQWERGVKAQRSASAAQLQLSVRSALQSTSFGWCLSRARLDAISTRSALVPSTAAKGPAASSTPYEEAAVTPGSHFINAEHFFTKGPMKEFSL